jgi:hypothetical protein
VSIRDSTHPTMLGSCPTEDVGFGVWASPAVHRAYVADDLRGLNVMSIPSYYVPSIDTVVLAAGLAYDVEARDSLMFVASDGFGLAAVDASDPTIPRQIGQLDSTRDMVTQCIATDDSFAFMGWAPNRPWLRSVSVADPTRPVKSGGVNVFGFPQDMVLRDSLLYVAQAYRFQVVNVARPREPVVVGTCNSLDGNEFGLAVQDSFAYEVSYPGLAVINIARPGAPTVVSTTGGLNASGVAVRDTFLYVPYAYDTLWTLSVADPQHPRIISGVPTSVWPFDIALADSIACIGTAEGVDLFSLADPALPRKLGSCPAPEAVRRVAYVAPYFYAAAFGAGVGIYETTSTGMAESDARQGRRRMLVAAPNPTTGQARLSGTLASESGAMVSIRDVSGRIVRQFGQKQDSGPAAALDLSSLPSGLYFVELRLGKQSEIVKLVKR